MFFRVNEIEGSLFMELSPIEITVNISQDKRREGSIFFREDDFLFFEYFIADVVPSYSNYGHWNDTAISKEQWDKIFKNIHNGIDLFQKNTFDLLEDFEYKDAVFEILKQQKPFNLFIENIKKVEYWIRAQLEISQCVCIYGI